MPSLRSSTAERPAASRACARDSAVGSTSSSASSTYGRSKSPSAVFHPEHASDGVVESRRIQGCGIQPDRGGCAAHLDVQTGPVRRTRGALEGLGDTGAAGGWPRRRHRRPRRHANPHSVLRTSVSSARFTCIGTPATVLNEAMIDATPACTGGAEGLEVDVAQPVCRDVGGVVVAAALGLPVADEVLRGRGDRARCGQVRSLIAAHHRRSHDRVQSTSSPKPSTTRPHRGSRETSIIGENVQLTPPERCLDAAVRASCSTMSGSKLAACPSGSRGDRALTVDHVEADQDRDAEPRVLDGVALQRVGSRRGLRPEHRTDPVARTREAASSSLGRKTICS